MKEYYDYLLAIIPSPEIVELLKRWKLFLGDNIGKFASDKSIAHFTILGFDVDENRPLSYWLERIESFCNNWASHEIGFCGLDRFGNNTFQVIPDKQSKKYLDNLTKALRKHMLMEVGNVNSHMSIARLLNEIQLQKATEIFKNRKTDFRFLCDGLILRKFCRSDFQYSELIKDLNLLNSNLNYFN